MFDHYFHIHVSVKGNSMEFDTHKSLYRNAQSVIDDEGPDGLLPSELKQFAEAAIEVFRQDVINFVQMQPERMITKNNVIGMIKGIKAEWGQ